MKRAEAIKKIRQMSLPKETVEILEALAPELKESEDEKIRKWLIDYFKKVGNSWIHREFTCEQIVAYLEKQKELFESGRGLYYYDGEKTTYCGYPATEYNPYDFAMSQQEKQQDMSKAIEAVDRIDKFIDEHLANAHDMKDSDPDKKYYRGWDDALGKMSGILQDVYSGEKQKDHFRDDAKMVEQKPAEWSEKDEKHRQWILECLADGKRKVPEFAEQYQAAFDWLKSRRPQSKIHYWTEEEIEPIISDYLTGKEHYGGMIARLRCLKPKSSWKPSEEELVALKRVGSILRDYGYGELAKTVFMIEGKLANLDVLNKPMWKPNEEQMKALNALNLHGNLSYVGQQNQLISLYQDLKKLM